MSILNLRFKEWMVVISFVLLSLSFLCNITELGYLDEVLGVISFFYLIGHIIKTRKIDKIFLCLFFLIAFGLLGNIVFNVNEVSLSDLCLDIFIFLKPYLLLLATFYFVGQANSKRIITWLRGYSKIMLFIIGAACFVYLFNKDLFSARGVFGFLGTFGGSLANGVILFLVFIFSKEEKANFLFLIIGGMIIYFSDSGLGLLGILLFLFFNYFLKYFHINIFWFVFFIFSALIVSWPEISSYLLNSSSARFLLFKYSFVTANRFFPFGSGFCSYGSFVTAKNYSSLYYSYGFNHVWGMTPDWPAFFYDSYYPMIIGEFGYFGLCLFLFILIQLLKKSIKNKSLVTRRLSICLFLYLTIMGLGFSFNSVDGCLLLMAFSLLQKKSNIQSNFSLHESILVLNQQCDKNDFCMNKVDKTQI